MTGKVKAEKWRKADEAERLLRHVLDNLHGTMGKVGAEITFLEKVGYITHEEHDQMVEALDNLGETIADILIEKQGLKWKQRP